MLGALNQAHDNWENQTIAISSHSPSLPSFPPLRSWCYNFLPSSNVSLAHFLPASRHKTNWISPTEYYISLYKAFFPLSLPTIAISGRAGLDFLGDFSPAVIRHNKEKNIGNTTESTHNAGYLLISHSIRDHRTLSWPRTYIAAAIHRVFGMITRERFSQCISNHWNGQALVHTMLHRKRSEIEHEPFHSRASLMQPSVVVDVVNVLLVSIAQIYPVG